MGIGVRTRACLLLPVIACAVLGVGQGTATASGTAATASQPGTWKTGFSIPGAAGSVYAAAVSGKDLYIGGTFSTFGGQPANHFSHIAMWDGTQWHQLGTGVDNYVRAITVLNGNVYVGGDFTHAGGVAAAHVAMWNGKTWSDIGGVSTSESGLGDTVEALANDGTNVYLGGEFDHAGTTPANSVAMYTPGAGFAAVGGGVLSCSTCGPNTRAGEVRSLLFALGDLWAGGTFAEAGTLVTANLASWNGTQWAGYGGVTVNGAQGTAVVSALTFDPATSTVYAGGGFNRAGSVSTPGVAALQGTTWSSVGGGLSGANGSTASVLALSVRNSILYATGGFTLANGTTPVADFAAFSQGAWSQPGGGLDLPGRALAVYGTAVFLGGDLYTTAQPGPVLNDAVLWTGTAWRSLGQGTTNATSGDVSAIVGDGTSGAYVGGGFTQLGSLPVAGVAHWTGTAWKALGVGVFTGTSGTVGHIYSMGLSGSDLYVAGLFSYVANRPGQYLAANNVAMWDGKAWHALGSNTTGGGLGGGLGRVRSLVVINGRVYFGGDFNLADGQSVNDVAIWDPASSTWSHIPGTPTFDSSVTNGSVYSLSAYGNRYLFIGGNYNEWSCNGTLYSVNNLNYYDTMTTSDACDGSTSPYFTLGGTDGNIQSMYIGTNNDIYVGGSFANANAWVVSGHTPVPAANIAVFPAATSTWTALGAGTDATVAAITVNNGIAYAGGYFAHAGGQAIPGVAAYNPATSQWMSLKSGGLVVPSGSPYSTGVGEALAPDTSTGIWVGGSFNQASTTESGGFAHWVPA